MKFGLGSGGWDDYNVGSIEELLTISRLFNLLCFLTKINLGKKRKFRNLNLNSGGWFNLGLDAFEVTSQLLSFTHLFWRICCGYCCTWRLKYKLYIGSLRFSKNLMLTVRVLFLLVGCWGKIGKGDKFLRNCDTLLN